MQLFAFGLLLFAWINPLHIQPWISWHSEVLAFASGILMFMSVLLKRQRRGVLRIPRSALIWPCLTLLTVLQFAMGQIDFLGDGLVLVFYFLLIFATIIVGYELETGPVLVAESSQIREGDALEQLAWTVLFGAFLSSVVALVQSTDVWLDSEWISRSFNLRRPGGNIAQPNQLATLEIMGLASMAFLVSKGRLKNLAAFFLYLVLTVGIGLTESRSGLLSSLALISWWFLCRKRMSAGISAIYPVVGFLLILLSFSFLPIVGSFLQEGGFGTGALPFASVSVGTRLTIWPQLLEASLQQPWLGWGLRQVSAAHNAVLHNYSAGEPFIYSHNIALDLVLGMGYPIAILTMIVVAVWLVRRIRLIGDINSWYCMALVLPVAVHSQLEFPFAYSYFLLPVSFAVGVLEGRIAPDSIIEVRLRPVVWGAGVVLVLMLWSVFEYIAVEADYSVARFEALRIGKTPESYDRPNIVLLTQMDAVLTVIRLIPTPGMAPESIELARKVAMRFPWPATQNRYALSLALNGSPDQAIRQLKVMRAMHGEKTYEGIKANWTELANTKYPQLKALTLP